MSKGQRLYRIALPVDAMGMPDFERIKPILVRMAELQANARILSASVVREGGMAAALVRMCLGNRCGFSFNSGHSSESLFATRIGDLLVSPVAEEDMAELDAEYLGETNGAGAIILNDALSALREVEIANGAMLEDVFHTGVDFVPPMASVQPCPVRPDSYRHPKIARPPCGHSGVPGHKLRTGQRAGICTGRGYMRHGGG